MEPFIFVMGLIVSAMVIAGLFALVPREIRRAEEEARMEEEKREKAV